MRGADAPGAEFPQVKPKGPALDFRSEKLPLAGLVGRGQRKKFSDAEKETLVAEFNCLPGRTLGREVEKARRALLLRDASQETATAMALEDVGSEALTGAFWRESVGQAQSAMDCDSREGEAEDAAAEALAAMARSKVPSVANALKTPTAAGSRLKSTSKIKQRR